MRIQGGGGLEGADVQQYWRWRVREWEAKERVLNESWIGRLFGDASGLREDVEGQGGISIIASSILKGLHHERELEIALRFILSKLNVWLTVGVAEIPIPEDGTTREEIGTWDQDRADALWKPHLSPAVFGRIVEASPIVEGLVWRVVSERNVWTEDDDGWKSQSMREAWLVLEAVRPSLINSDRGWDF